MESSASVVAGAMKDGSRQGSNVAQASSALLLNEIVSSEGSLAPGLRAVYENHHIDKQQFMDKLDGYARRIDEDVEKVCSRNYQGFVDSVQDLLHLKPHADELKHAIGECKDNLKDAGDHLYHHADELHKERRKQRDILAVLEAIAACRPAIALFGQARRQLADKLNYAALKSLQSLEELELLQVSTFAFIQKIRQQIPEIRAEIKEASFDDMRQFLSEVRLRSEALGALTIKETTKKLQTEESGAEKRQQIAAAEVDYSGLYRCLHTCHVLGAAADCSSYYKQERQKQAELVLAPVGSMDSEKTYRQYFHSVAGFFIAEHVVATTTQGLTTRQWLDSLWQQALTSIGKVMHQQLARCSTASMIREVKQLIVDFNTTLNAHSYSVNRLTDVLLQVRSRYQAVLVMAAAEAFKAILAEDNYTQITVEVQSEYDKVVDLYPYPDKVFAELPCPKTFPFSWAVPRVYAEVRQFIDKSYQFLENIGLSSTEVDEMIRQSTNHLLSKVLSAIMTKTVRKQNLAVQQLVLVSLNTTQLETACEVLEEYISNTTKAVGNEVHATQLHGKRTFKDARSAAETGILESFQQQIDLFFELAEYDWAPGEHQDEPSDYLVQMLSYLSTMFASLKHMPMEVARVAYFNSCKYIGNRLLSLVSAPEIRKVNMNGIRSFAVDVATCEAYANNNQVVAESDQLFKDVFIHLRELVDVFLNEDWDRFCEPNVRRQYYPHLKPEIALSWLEKFDDSDKASLFSRTAGENRRKAKQTESIIRRLRAGMA
eukprot:TRINITY_DN9864_c0_g1_i1.p1 TRINITY_DN9864_c0_g1~~TRINITY_DN9864_c0_g1_i1.p1  ORF type:complete len:771 (+),score=183.97 TRINITY_DN9864_c0_g1_i1:103-2415(+)